MKIILALSLIIVVFISGCLSIFHGTFSHGECGYFALRNIKINTTINDKYDAFNTIKTLIQSGTYETYGDYIDDGTRKATIDKLYFVNISLGNGSSSEAWILNDEAGIGKNGNLYIKCHPL